VWTDKQMKEMEGAPHAVVVTSPYLMTCSTDLNGLYPRLSTVAFWVKDTPRSVTITSDASVGWCIRCNPYREVGREVE